MKTSTIPPMRPGRLRRTATTAFVSATLIVALSAFSVSCENDDDTPSAEPVDRSDSSDRTGDETTGNDSADADDSGSDDSGSDDTGGGTPDIVVPPTADPTPVDDVSGPGTADMPVDLWWDLFQRNQVEELAGELATAEATTPAEETVLTTFEALVAIGRGDSIADDAATAAQTVLAAEPGSSIGQAATVVLAQALGDGLVEQSRFDELVDQEVLDHLTAVEIVAPDIGGFDPSQVIDPRLTTGVGELAPLDGG